jgi:hypothetical protein
MYLRLRAYASLYYGVALKQTFFRKDKTKEITKFRLPSFVL